MSTNPLSTVQRLRRRFTIGVAAAAAVLAALASQAQADSIAYIKGGNVWLATGDGSRQFQVTATGEYSDVSQADDGTMIALAGVRLRKLDRYGHVLADFDTPVSDGSPPASRTFWGPFDPKITPDGSKVAYSWFYTTQSQTGACYPPQCVTTINEAGTGYSRSDRATEWSEPGFAEHTGWRNPVWVDNSTTVLSDPSHLPNADVVVDQTANRSGPTGFLVNNWFSDTLGGNAHVGGGDISRDRTKAVYVTGENDSTLTMYRIPSFPTQFQSGDAPASTIPSVCYRYGNPVGGGFGIPAFSPDGTRIVFAVGDGIHIADVPDFTNGCTTTGASTESRLLIPGATEPDWGPADVPIQPAGGSTGSTGTPAPKPCAGGCSKKPHLTLSTPSTATLRAAITHGLTVRIAGARPRSIIRVVARSGHRTVASGSTRIGASGTGRLRLILSRRALAHKGHRKVTLTVAAPEATVTVTLRG
jgi:hypothetical protein